jgi:hypothetical protein
MKPKWTTRTRSARAWKNIWPSKEPRSHQPNDRKLVRPANREQSSTDAFARTVMSQAQPAYLTVSLRDLVRYAG